MMDVCVNYNLMNFIHKNIQQNYKNEITQIIYFDSNNHNEFVLKFI